MKFINLTSHSITEVTTGMTIPRSGIVARVKTQCDKVATHLGVPIYETTLNGDIEGLPEPEEGTVYIVSSLVLNSIPINRVDVVAPGNVQRDHKRRIVGCIGFRRK